jgi:exosortase K
MNLSISHHRFPYFRQAVPFCIVLALAFALKRYYSLAEVDSLVWILAPTARLVGFATGIPFAFEHGTGFVNLDHRVVIAPACAGINFIIIVFCMIGFSLISRSKNERTQLLVILAAFCAAYFLTIAVNALRISLAVYLYDTNFHFGWLTRERIHRLEGTLVYFVCLCGIYSLINCRLFRQDWTMVRRVMVPAAWYLAMTLAVPVILGKFSVYGWQLVEHGMSVLAIPVIFVLVFWIIKYTGKKDRIQAIEP